MAIIETVGLGKQYQICYEKGALARYLLPKFLRRRKFGDFWAIKEINFSLEPGQAIGVIGPNGSGKSTLLALCSGITAPTAGRVDVRGKVNALLTLGAGFHPELSGRENVYLNGTILGLTIGEIRKKMDSILQFSGLGHLIEAPLQTYSTGMVMRLGFAIAMHASFDFLVIDEILSVGDGAFQKKCLAKLAEFKKEGKGLIIATHDLEIVKHFCEKALFLDAGRQAAYGNAEETVRTYQESLNNGGAEYDRLSEMEKRKILAALKGVGALADRPSPDEKDWVRPKSRFRSGIGKVKIKRVYLLDREDLEVSRINHGDFLRVRVEYEVEELVEDPHFGVAVYRDDGVYCFGPNTRFDGFSIRSLKPGQGWFQLTYPSLPLLGGRFSFSVAIWDREEKHGYDSHHAMYPLRIRSVHPGYGVVSLAHQWFSSGQELAGHGNLLLTHHGFQQEMEEKIGRLLLEPATAPAQRGVALDSLKIIEPFGKGSLQMGGDLSIEGVFDSESPVEQLAVWVGLFRSDGILCYATSSFDDGILLELNPGKNIWSVLFPSLPLLRGKFRVGIAWADRRGSAFGIIPEAGWFTVKESVPHHGLVSIKREWKGTALVCYNWFAHPTRKTKSS